MRSQISSVQEQQHRHPVRSTFMIRFDVVMCALLHESSFCKDVYSRHDIPQDTLPRAGLQGVDRSQGEQVTPPRTQNTVVRQAATTSPYRSTPGDYLSD